MERSPETAQAPSASKSQELSDWDRFIYTNFGKRSAVVPLGKFARSSVFKFQLSLVLMVVFRVCNYCRCPGHWVLPLQSGQQEDFQHYDASKSCDTSGYSGPYDVFPGCDQETEGAWHRNLIGSIFIVGHILYIDIRNTI
jgi:hypothetical protein